MVNAKYYSNTKIQLTDDLVKEPYVRTVKHEVDLLSIEGLAIHVNEEVLKKI